MLRTKRLTGKRRDIVRRVTVREEVSVIEVYWQLILRAGCARFVGHDTLPSQRATGKPRRDVLRRPTRNQTYVLLSVLPPVDATRPESPVCAPCVFVSRAGSVLFPEYLRYSQGAHKPDRVG